MLLMSINASTKKFLVHSGLAGIIGLLLITWLHIRPLGIIFLLTFFFWFYKTKIGFEITAPEELKRKINEATKIIITMRQEKPTLFCGIACVVLGSMAILGHLLSGSSAVLGGLMISVLISSKYNFKMLEIKKTEFKWQEKVQENDMDEFLLEVNEATLDVLERASHQTNISVNEDSEEKSEEVPNDLMIPDCIPEIDEHSTDEDDALGIDVPEDVAERGKVQTEIEFKKRHFKKDSSISTSSSSDEDNLSKGLLFPDHAKIDRNINHKEQLQTQSQSMIVASNVLPGIVSGLVSWASTSSNMPLEPFRPPQNSSLSDSESEFEFLNTDEY